MDRFLETVPAEIFEAFSQKDLGFSLLIKGNAGAGKTTFALTLLSLFEDTEPIYVSTRVAPKSLFLQFPWLKNKLKDENIIDATRTYLPPIRDSKELKTHVMQTIRFTSAPDFLKILYDRIDDSKNMVIIIDSWDAIIGLESNEKKQEWETLFTEFIRQMNAKLILITEHNDVTFLDYIVDGIINMIDSEIDNRIIREIEISKIRGVERRQKRYNFTLFNNEFLITPPFKEYHNNIDNLMKIRLSDQENKPTKNNNLISFGNEELNKLYLGGLKPSTLNLWEIDSDVPLSIFSNIMITIITNFVSNKCGSIIYTSDGLNSKYIEKNQLFLQLEPEKISQYIKFLIEKPIMADQYSIDDNRPYITQFDNEDFMNAFIQTYNKLAQLTSYNPVLSIITYNLLTINDNFSQLFNQVYRQLKFVRNFNIIAFGIINRSIPANNVSINLENRVDRNSIKDLSFFFDTHVKMILKNNSVFVYGIKPYTGLFFVKLNRNKQNNLEISLIPMV